MALGTAHKTEFNKIDSYECKWFLVVSPPPPSSHSQPPWLLSGWCEDIEKDWALIFPRTLPATEVDLLCTNSQCWHLWMDDVLNLVSLVEWHPCCLSSLTSSSISKWQLHGTKVIPDLFGFGALLGGLHPQSLHQPHLALPGWGSNNQWPIMEKWTITTIALQISKEWSHKISNAGMSYGWQYWHYRDKWLLTLVCLGQIWELWVHHWVSLTGWVKVPLGWYWGSTPCSTYFAWSGLQGEATEHVSYIHVALPRSPFSWWHQS